jgi:hypothetical protein
VPQAGLEPARPCRQQVLREMPFCNCSQLIPSLRLVFVGLRDVLGTFEFVYSVRFYEVSWGFASMGLGRVRDHEFRMSDSVAGKGEVVFSPVYMVLISSWKKPGVSVA